MLGDRRDFVGRARTIDLTAVGNWAEPTILAYGSYQDSAGTRASMSCLHGMSRNESIAGRGRGDGGRAGARLSILHKELDADDGEVTRTQKVAAALSER